jgi:hypothetical protein
MPRINEDVQCHYCGIHGSRPRGSEALPWNWKHYNVFGDERIVCDQCINEGLPRRYQSKSSGRRIAYAAV